MSEEKPPVWTAVEKTIKGATPDKNRVEGRLLANGVVVHVVSGPNGYHACSSLAEDYNLRGVPAPEPQPRTRADGWRQRRDQVRISIPREVIDWKCPE